MNKHIRPLPTAEGLARSGKLPDTGGCARPGQILRDIRVRIRGRASESERVDKGMHKGVYNARVGDEEEGSGSHKYMRRGCVRTPARH